MKSIPFSLAFLLMSIFFGSLRASAADISATYEAVKPALALLSYSGGGHIHFGTAFCVRATPTASYFLTNRHVVDVREKLHVDLLAARGRTFEGTVVALSTDVDAAMIRVNVGNIKALRIASNLPRVGQPVSIIGFPLFQMRYSLTSHNLVASLHSGMVNALLFDGGYFEYDAQTDKGNSGGPIVDSGSGMVYGLVTYIFPGASSVIQNNVGVSVSDLSEMLAGIHISSRAPAPSENALQSAQAFFLSAVTSTQDTDWR